MKKIFAGLIGTVFTVFLTLFAQGWYNRHQQQTEFQLNWASYDSAAHLSPSQRRKVMAAGDDSLNISLFEIVNAGNKPLTDQRVTIRTEAFGSDSEILAAGSTKYPGNDESGVQALIDKNVLQIDYKILNPREQHRIWLIDNGIGLSTLTARKPGLRVNNIERTFNDPSIFEDSVFLIFISVMFGLLTFGLGAALGWSGLADEIKKRGFSPEEILKIKPELPPPPSKA